MLNNYSDYNYYGNANPDIYIRLSENNAEQEKKPLNIFDIKILLSEFYNTVECNNYTNHRNFNFVNVKFNSLKYIPSTKKVIVNCEISSNSYMIRKVVNEEITLEYIEKYNNSVATNHWERRQMCNNYGQARITAINGSTEHTCEACNKEIKGSEYKKWSGFYYCSECVSKLFNTCSCCDNLIFKGVNNPRMVDRERYCENCFWEHYTICQNCDETMSVDDSCYDDSTDSHYCQSCYDNLDRLIDFNCKRLDFKNNTFKKLKSKRCFGIELEVDDSDILYNDIDKNTHFGSKYDGSLSKGAELYSPILQGDLGYKDIEKICSLLRHNSVTNNSGYHLHIDSRDLDWGDIKKVWLIYRIVEPMLYAILPNNRRENSYCKVSKKMIDSIVEIKSREDLKNVWYEDSGNYNEDSRYHGFNLHAWFVHNTIELRYHSGTINFDKVINWIKINLAIFEYALNNSEETILELLNYNKCKTNYTIIRRIFKTITANKSLWKYYKKRYKAFSDLKHGDYFPQSKSNGSFRNFKKVAKSDYKINIKHLLKLCDSAKKNVKEEPIDERELVLI